MRSKRTAKQGARDGECCAGHLASHPEHGEGSAVRVVEADSSHERADVCNVLVRHDGG